MLFVLLKELPCAVYAPVPAGVASLAGAAARGDPVDDQARDRLRRRRMNRMYKFIWHRGILAMWVVHPVYRALLVVRDYPQQRDASLKLWGIPVLSVHVDEAGGRWKVLLNPPGWMEEYLLKRILHKPGLLALPLSAIWLVVSRRAGEIKLWERLKAYAVIAGLLAYVLTLMVTSNLIFNLGLAMARAGVTTVKAVARSIPALLAVLFVGFATGDAWRIFGQEPGWRFAALVVALVGAGLAAMLVNLRTADGWQSVFLKCQVADGKGVMVALEEWGKRTPARKLPEKRQPVPPLGISDDALPPVLDRARAILAGNVCILFWLTMWFSVIWTAVCISLIFLVIGILAISLPTTNDLLSSPPGHPLAVIVYQFGLLGQQVVITRQLLLLSVVLGSVAALTFAASTLQDADSRATFEDHALKSLRRAFAALGYYLAEVAALLRQLQTKGTLEKIDGIDAGEIEKLLQIRAALPLPWVQPPAENLASLRTGI
jgi:hypothetical protein